jgi:hypothetical protein
MDGPEQSREKSCPYCTETIPSAAKICPRCRQWLSVRSFRNPYVGVTLIFLPMFFCFVAMGAAVLRQMQKITNPPPYYSDSRGAIEVLDAKMSWAQTSEGLRLYFTGMITNRSALAWKRPEFECRLFNSKKQMIDAATVNGYLTILPESDAAFRVSVYPVASTNEYDSFKIFVSSAYNVKGY